MALITIHSDGTFEAVAAISTNKITLASVVKTVKEVIKRVDRDLITTAKIDTLKATRDKERAARDKLKAMKIPSVHKGKDLANFAKKINKLSDAIDTLTLKLSAGRYLKPSVLKSRATSAQAKLKKFEAAWAKQQAKLTAAPKTPRTKPSTTLPKLDGAPRTPRVPKDKAAAFEREAKLAAGSISRGIRSELRDHGKTALVPVRNSAGAKPATAVPSSKKADTATTHATKPARGAIGNTLAEIKKIKASIATGTLKGAKLIRAREELEKQRTALRGLRAGKTAKNQKSIVPQGKAAHMGGAKKIVGKPSGMGEPGAALQKMHNTMGGIHEKRLKNALVAAKGDAALSRKIRKMIKENREEPGMHSKKELSAVGAK